MVHRWHWHHVVGFRKMPEQRHEINTRLCPPLWNRNALNTTWLSGRDFSFYCCFTCMTLVWISSSWERLLRCLQTSWYFVYCSLRESRSFITWGWASSSSSMGDQAVPLPPPSEPLKRLCWSSESNSCPVKEVDNRSNKHLWQKNQGLEIPWKGNVVNSNKVFHMSSRKKAMNANVMANVLICQVLYYKRNTDLLNILWIH